MSHLGGKGSLYPPLAILTSFFNVWHWMQGAGKKCQKEGSIRTSRILRKALPR
jgi:hypothetical protein